MADRLHTAQLVINEVEKAVVGKRDILTKIMSDSCRRTYIDRGYSGDR